MAETGAGVGSSPLRLARSLAAATGGDAGGGGGVCGCGGGTAMHAGAATSTSFSSSLSLALSRSTSALATRVAPAGGARYAALAATDSLLRPSAAPGLAAQAERAAARPSTGGSVRSRRDGGDCRES